MPLRRAQPYTFRFAGLSDGLDGSDTFEGAALSLSNLIPNPDSAGQWVPRVASTQVTNFTGFTTPGLPTLLFIVGTTAYGFVPSGRFAGKDEPFVYDLVAGTFTTLVNVTAANCPTTQPTTGDWTPPTAAMVSGRVLLTHPGYNGTTTFIGWIDVSSFTLATLTATTAIGSPNLTAVSSNPLLVGVRPGMQVAGAGIPAGAYIVSMTAGTIVLSANATAAAAGVALTITGGTTAAPLYGAGNVNTNPFTRIPTCVSAFNNRAYYGMLNFAVYSDVLNPTQITNATQALTVGDNAPVTALAGLPLNSQFIGGVNQSLIAFKGAASMWQILGDAATADLRLDVIQGSVGTLAPNTITPTTLGLAYMAPDGYRMLGLNGQASDPIGARGSGVTKPFINAVTPSRACAAFNGNVLRASVQNGLSVGQVVEEYWFHLDLKVWSGPHTFPASMIEAYYGGTGDTFILAASGIAAKLWQSSPVQPLGASYTENGTALTFTAQTSLLPDNQEMAGNQVVETTLAAQVPAAQMFSVLVADEEGDVLGTAYVNGSGEPTAIWSAFNWGAAAWGSGASVYRQYALSWAAPLVFKQASVRVSGLSLANTVLGDLRIRYQVLGYLLTWPS